MSFLRSLPWRALGLLAGLVLACTLAIQGHRPPRLLGLEAPATAFSALRARTHLAWLGAEPHPTGSPAHGRVRDRLVAAFREAGLEVQTQRAVLQRPPRFQARTNGLVWVENILARLKGTGGGGAVLVATHYDSAPGSHGASDAGAGVISQLEILRALKAGPPLRHDVIFLATDAEELGLVGAEAFVRAHPWRQDVKRVVNLEARGTGGVAWVHETSEGNADLVEALAQGTPRPAASSLAYEISRMLPNGTDLMVFRPAGIRAMGLAFTDGVWNYHYPTDDAAHQDPGSLQQMGETCLGLVRTFAQGDLGPGNGRDAVYFNLPGTRLVHYPASWVPWLSLLGTALGLAVLLRAFRRDGLRWGALGRGLALAALGLLGAAGLGALLRALLTWLHPLWGVREVLLSFSQGPYALLYNPWYLMVPVAAVPLAFSLVSRLDRSDADRVVPREAGPRPVGPLAVLVVWGLLAPLLSWALPGGSFLFQWPWLLALAAWLVAPRNPWALVPAALAQVGLLVVLVPTLGSALGLTTLLAAVLPVWLLLSVWLVEPLVQEIRRAHLLLPTAAGLALVGLVGGGLWARATFQGRAFANVAYAVNLDTGRAWWMAERQHEGPWTRRFLDRPNPGEPAWEGDGTLRPGREATMCHQEAPLLPVPQPGLEVRSDHTEGGVRTLHLAVTGAGAEELVLEGGADGLLRAEVEGHVLISRPLVRALDGAPTAHTEARKDWRFNLVAPPVEAPVAVVLSYAVSGAAKGGALRLGLQARYGGLPAGVGGQPPAGLRPIEHGNRTLVSRVLEPKAPS